MLLEANPDAADDAALAVAAALLAQRLGDAAAVDSVLDALGKAPRVRGFLGVAEMADVLQAERERRAGRPLKAVALLEPWLSGHERFQTRVALMEAYADAGQRDDALAQARWLQAHRGLAYAELDCGYCRQALNVADSNRAAQRERALRATAGAEAAQ
jgi:hypothetical protein